MIIAGDFRVRFLRGDFAVFFRTGHFLRRDLGGVLFRGVLFAVIFM